MRKSKHTAGVCQYMLKVRWLLIRTNLRAPSIHLTGSLNEDTTQKKKREVLSYFHWVHFNVQLFYGVVASVHRSFLSVSLVDYDCFCYFVIFAWTLVSKCCYNSLHLPFIRLGYDENAHEIPFADAPNCHANWILFNNNKKRHGIFDQMNRLCSHNVSINVFVLPLLSCIIWGIKTEKRKWNRNRVMKSKWSTTQYGAHTIPHTLSPFNVYDICPNCHSFFAMEIHWIAQAI